MSFSPPLDDELLRTSYGAQSTYLLIVSAADGVTGHVGFAPDGIRVWDGNEFTRVMPDFFVPDVTFTVDGFTMVFGAIETAGGSSVETIAEQAIESEHADERRERDTADLAAAGELHPDVFQFWNMPGHRDRVERETNLLWSGHGTWFYDPDECSRPLPPEAQQSYEGGALDGDGTPARAAMTWEEFQVESAALLEESRRDLK